MTDRHGRGSHEGGRFKGQTRSESGLSLPSVTGLDPAERSAIIEQFGVSTQQVERDHLISHVLGSLSAMEGNHELVFFGGTALSRTSLPNLRLSEDIDLITKTNRSQMAARIMEALDNSLARTHGQVTWNKALNATKGSEPSVLRVGETGVQIQLLSADGYPNWPTEISDLEQRYSDAPAARLTVLTQASFVAAKTAAWMDRSSPRDLYDLWALAEQGSIDHEALDVYKRHGPTGSRPSGWVFKTYPSEDEWNEYLEHQGRIQASAAEAALAVGAAWSAA